MLINTFKNISWLPQNSKIELYKSNKLLVSSKIEPVTAVHAFVKYNNKIIVLKHTNKNRGFEIPGGHIEKNESQVMALKRECKEEIGFEITNIQPIGYQKIIKEVLEEKYPYYISYQTFFEAEIMGNINLSNSIMIDNILYLENTNLEQDSECAVIMEFNDFINSKNEKCYYIELLKDNLCLK